MSIAERYHDLRRRADAAARAAGRDPAGVRIVCVGKGHPIEALREAYDAGARDFGENRADELRAKAQALPADARWHFVGHLQSNKLKVVLEANALIHSLDRGDLADRMRGRAALLQVYLGGEGERSGVAPAKVEEALLALSRGGVPIVGLMVLPPKGEDPQAHFRRLRMLRDELLPRWPFLVELSMGMSEDFEAAIAEGATMVRLGRALFGERPA